MRYFSILLLLFVVSCDNYEAETARTSKEVNTYICSKEDKKLVIDTYLSSCDGKFSEWYKSYRLREKQCHLKLVQLYCNKNNRTVPHKGITIKPYYKPDMDR